MPTASSSSASSRAEQNTAKEVRWTLHAALLTTWHACTDSGEEREHIRCTDCSKVMAFLLMWVRACLSVFGWHLLGESRPRRVKWGHVWPTCSHTFYASTLLLFSYHLFMIKVFCNQEAAISRWSLSQTFGRNYRVNKHLKPTIWKHTFFSTAFYMKGVQECYDLRMKSPARKGWKQLLTRLKETHLSLSGISGSEI